LGEPFVHFFPLGKYSQTFEASFHRYIYVLSWPSIIGRSVLIWVTEQNIISRLQWP
jgi:hypothetical protein